MSSAARGSGRVSCRPDTNEKTDPSHKNSSKRVSGEKTGSTTSCRFRVPKRSELSPLRFLKRIGDQMAAALRFVRRRRQRQSSATAASSSARSNSSIAPLDSHRAEAINDCIEFINSSSSFQRSNSVPASSC